MPPRVARKGATAHATDLGRAMARTLARCALAHCSAFYRASVKTTQRRRFQRPRHHNRSTVARMPVPCPARAVMVRDSRPRTRTLRTLDPCASAETAERSGVLCYFNEHEIGQSPETQRGGQNQDPCQTLSRIVRNCHVSTLARFLHRTDLGTIFAPVNDVSTRNSVRSTNVVGTTTGPHGTTTVRTSNGVRSTNVVGTSDTRQGTTNDIVTIRHDSSRRYAARSIPIKTG
jgi:hypothetical protein